MIPCQDTCAAKVTYEATIAAPQELTVLMSAVRQGDATPLPSAPAGVSAESVPGCGSGKWAVTRFEQKIPVPSYLIAVVCGKLASRRIGPRSHVWSEEELLDVSEHEFKEHTEKFLSAGEELNGPYMWGVYDLLVLPPSFPYGGMENPCLTFVTPSLIAGDRSQVSVVAHEIAHSWSGNLVTNRTPEHFWLNEGLTVFTEIKIVEKVLGSDSATILTSDNMAACRQSVDRFGKDHNYTRLVPDLSGHQDPDDSFSVIPYAKGMSMFTELQRLAGGRPAFEPFVRAYLKKFALGTVDSNDLREFYTEHFPEASAKIDWDTWFYAPGHPISEPEIDPAPGAAAAKLAEAWVEVRGDARKAKELEDISGWPSLKVCAFLDNLQGKDLDKGTAQLLCETYSLFEKNMEVRQRAIVLALKAGWDGAIGPCERMAVSIGRMKYTRPLYRALHATDPKRARALFDANKDTYHPICTKMLTKELAA